MISFLNLLGTTTTEKQALEFLIVVTHEFQKNQYRFTGNDLTTLQLRSIFNHELSTKKTVVDFYGKKFTSFWQIINYLCEKGYLNKELNSTYYVTTQ